MPGTETTRKYLNTESAAELLAEWRSSGTSLEAFADAHGLNAVTLTRWMRRLNATAGSREITPAFVQVQSMPLGDITVHAQGVSIQIPASLLDQSLPAVLRALRC
jgi:hypothetical protein